MSTREQGVMAQSPGGVALYRWERIALVLFTVLAVGFGVLTEVRSCFLTLQHTDFGMLARAGWAVRTGGDIYQVTCDRGLHYPYPAAFAAVVVPFADPPAGADRAGYLPFPVSVAVWYTLSVVALFWTTHALAGAVLPDDRLWTRRWWYARTAPVYACLGGVGFSLGRGQVTIFLVALIAAAFLSALRGHPLRAGAWLGAAVVIKLIPAYLILFPLVRRDWVFGVGGVAALVTGIVVIPVAIWGPAGAVEKHTYFLKHVVQAGATGAGGDRLGRELTRTTATDSQSPQAAIHNIRHLNTPKAYRPPQASTSTRLIHWGIAAVLTLAALLVAYRRLTPAPADQLVFLGCVCALMIVVTPVSHMHYYAFVLPLAAGLWLKGMTLRPGEALAGPGTITALAAWGAATALPLFPGQPFEFLRDSGFGITATICLIGYGLWMIGRRTAVPNAGVPTVFLRRHQPTCGPRPTTTPENPAL